MAATKRVMTKATLGWALINEKGHIVTWRTLGPEPEEGIEIHRTRKLAQGAKFADEYVVPVMIVPRPTREQEPPK
jgi:hypothetical protein